jgi:hypothetical protein
MLELDGERRDNRFILVWALDHDRVITLRPVGISLCVRLIVFCRLFTGVPTASIYIGREDCSAFRP